MKVLFLTRKYPPQTGGMETFCWELSQRYEGEKDIVHHGAKQRDILWALPALFFAAFRRRREIDVIHLGDLLLAALGPLLKVCVRKPIVATVHGLELTYSNPLFKYTLGWKMRFGLKYIDHIVAVSENTSRLLQELGYPKEQISIITHGTAEPKAIERGKARAILCRSLGVQPLKLQESFLLLTVGRHVKRKGVEWCIRNVLPEIVDLKPLYLITSTGPETEHIKKAIEETGMQEYARLLGRVNDDMLPMFYTGCDAFLMPNIHVPGDVEGFGFVAIEASSYGLPVLASNIDGISAAVHNGKNGVLVEAENAQAYIEQLRDWHTHSEERAQLRSTASAYTAKEFHWDKKVAEYTELFNTIANL